MHGGHGVAALGAQQQHRQLLLAEVGSLVAAQRQKAKVAHNVRAATQRPRAASASGAPGERQHEVHGALRGGLCALVCLRRLLKQLSRHTGVCQRRSVAQSRADPPRSRRSAVVRRTTRTRMCAMSAKGTTRAAAPLVTSARESGSSTTSNLPRGARQATEGSVQVAAARSTAAAGALRSGRVSAAAKTGNGMPPKRAPGGCCARATRQRRQRGAQLRRQRGDCAPGRRARERPR